MNTARLKNTGLMKLKAPRLFSRGRFAAVFCAALILLFAAGAHAEKIGDREVLENGLVVLHSERKMLPIIKVVMAVKAGNVSEPAGKAGLANLTADLLNEGTAKRTAHDISEAIEFVGGSLSASGGGDYITISLSVLKKDVDLGFDLLSDIIMNPAFRDEEIKRRKTLIKNSIIRQKDEPGAVASKAFLREVFGEHPYGRPVEGTEESLEKITRQDILDFHDKFYAPNNSIIGVSGDLSGKELHDLLSKYFGGWKKREIPSPALPAVPAGDGPRVIKISRNLTQSSIILGHAGITRDNPDYYAATVMNYILGAGGFASRLMDNIRDNMGLAYDVHSYFSAGKYSGHFAAGLQTKNSTAGKAIDEIIREMNRIRTEPVSDRELSDAKSYLTGSFPLRLDTNGKVAGIMVSVEFFGLGEDYVEKYKSLINSVTKEDVMNAARKYLDPKNYVLAIVGDIEKADLKY